MGFPPALPLDTGRASSIVICCIVFPCLAALTVVARFVARRQKAVKYGWDDYLVVLALLALFGQLTILILGTIYGGVGHHNVRLSSENIAFQYKVLAAVQFTFGTSVGFMKMSICVLLIRVFGLNKAFRLAAWCALGLCIAWTIMVISIGAGLCRPFSYNWNRDQDGSCGNSVAAYISIAATDIGVDAVLITLPMPWLWRLQMATKTKIGLTVVFALAFLDIIVAILRIYYLVNTSYAEGADFSWVSSGTFVWSVIEPSLGIIVACAPVLGPAIKHCVPWGHAGTQIGQPISSRASNWQTPTNPYSGVGMAQHAPLGQTKQPEVSKNRGDDEESQGDSGGVPASDEHMQISVRTDLDIRPGSIIVSCLIGSSPAMSADDDTFEIDIYGDDQPEQPEPTPAKAESEQQPTTDNVKDELQDNGNLSQQDNTQEADASETSTSHQGVKRKAEDDESDIKHDPSTTNDQYHNDEYVDNRPVDPGAMPALRLADLHWWTTEEDLRYFCAQAQAENELDELSFGEHKINGKSKGEAYLAFDTPQAATAVKREIEKAASEGVEGAAAKKVPFTVYFTPVGNPYKTGAGAGNKKDAYNPPPPGARGGGYNNFGGRGGGGFGGRGNFNARGGGGGGGFNNNHSAGGMMGGRGGGQAGGWMNPMAAAAGGFGGMNPMMMGMNAMMGGGRG
ncbi:hypothetical protein KC363_g3103, partial [Hortaea werneckii]